MSIKVINPKNLESLVWDENVQGYVGTFTIGPSGLSDHFLIELDENSDGKRISVELLNIDPQIPNTKNSIDIVECDTFKLYSSSSTVIEGSSVTITLVTNAGAGEYHYTINGENITEDDIVEGLTGKFIVDESGEGFVILNISKNLDGQTLNEIFTLELDNKKSKIDIEIVEVGYILTANPNIVSEDEITFVTLQTNAPDGLYPYTIVGDSGFSSEDFDGNIELSGNFDVKNGFGQISLPIKKDYLTEGPENFTVFLDDTEASVLITVKDTSKTPTYKLTSVPDAIQEGESVTIKLVTTNLDEDEKVYYTITSDGNFDVENEFVSGTQTAGFFTIGEYGTAEITLQTKEDFEFEDTEYFTLKLDGIEESVTVPVTNIEFSYVLTATPNPVDEGESVTITLETNDQDGSYPYTITGDSEFSLLDDFVGGINSTGTFNVQDGIGTIALPPLKIDNFNEGQESFTLSLDGKNKFIEILVNEVGPQVFQGNVSLLHNVTSDSTGPEPGPNDELDSHFISINLSEWTGGEQILQWEISGDVNSNDISVIETDKIIKNENDVLKGVWEVDQNSNHVLNIQINLDSSLELSEIINFKLIDVYGNLITVSGTIVDPEPTYELTASTDSANEGTTVTLELQTTGLNSGDPVPFTISDITDNIDVNDFVGLDSLGAGEFIVDANGYASYPLQIRADSTTEGLESFTVTLDGLNVFVDVNIGDTSQTLELEGSPVVLGTTDLRLQSHDDSDTSGQVEASSAGDIPARYTLEPWITWPDDLGTYTFDWKITGDLGNDISKDILVDPQFQSTITVNSDGISGTWTLAGSSPTSERNFQIYILFDSVNEGPENIYFTLTDPNDENNTITVSGKIFDPAS